VPVKWQQLRELRSFDQSGHIWPAEQGGMPSQIEISVMAACGGGDQGSAAGDAVAAGGRNGCC